MGSVPGQGTKILHAMEEWSLQAAVRESTRHNIMKTRHSQTDRQIFLINNTLIMYQFRKYVTLNFSGLVFQFNHPVMPDSLRPRGLEHARLPCPSPTPRACSNSCPLSRWCHPTISSSDVPFSSCLQSFPASGSFPRSQFFASSSQSIGVSASASVLPVNIQDWFPLGWTRLVFRGKE